MNLSTLDLPGIPKLRSGKVREVFDLGGTVSFSSPPTGFRRSTASCPTRSRTRAACSRSFRRSGSGTCARTAASPTTSSPRISRAFPARPAALRGATRRPLDDRAPRPAAAGGVHRARLPRRVGLEGIPGHRQRLRPQTAAGSPPGRRPARTDFHPGLQGRHRPRRKHRLADVRRAPGRRGGGRGVARGELARSTRSAPRTPPRRGHHHRGHEIRVRRGRDARARFCSSTNA